MKWFPSGKKDLRLDNEHERIQIAGEMLQRATEDLKKEDKKTDQIYFLQEIRDAVTCSNLIFSLNNREIKLASISSFNTGGAKDWQQMAILTSLPVLDSDFEAWHNEDGISPPRGFTYALLSYKDGYIACFSIHLKSNLNKDGSIYGEQLNIFKRESSARQLLNKIKEIKEKYNDKKIYVLIAGDFNTNIDNPQFISENTLRSLYAAHYRSCFRDLKLEDRITCPGKGEYPDATFDYILYKDFPTDPETKIYDGSAISDHNIVTIKIE